MSAERFTLDTNILVYSIDRAAGAKHEQAVRIVQANRELEVAKIENDAATAQARAIMFKAEAEAAVVNMQNTAEATVMANQVQAFSNGMNYARYTFFKKVGPRVETILSTDQGDGLGALFLPFLPQTPKEVK